MKRLLLIIGCYWASVKTMLTKFRGPVRTIVIIQSAKLGDMVCTTPMFRAVKSAHPNIRVVVVGNKINKELLEGSKDVDEYIIYDKYNVRAVARQICGFNPDFGCVATPNTEGLAMLILAGVPHICAPVIRGGKSPLETISFRVLRILVTSIPHHMRKYTPREYLRLLEPIGIVSEDTTKHLSFSSEAKERADEFLRAGGILPNDVIVGISPVAGNRIKMWPAERFAAVADFCSAQYGAKILIIASPREREDVESMISMIDSKTKFLTTTGGLSSIEELKAIIAKLTMFVSVDTGPIYIAEAFHVPTIDITGPIDEHEQPPIGPRNIVIVPPTRSSPELFVMNARSYNYEEARRQAESISVDSVCRACAVLLSS